MELPTKTDTNAMTQAEEQDDGYVPPTAPAKVLGSRHVFFVDTKNTFSSQIAEAIFRRLTSDRNDLGSSSVGTDPAYGDLRTKSPITVQLLQEKGMDFSDGWAQGGLEHEVEQAEENDLFVYMGHDKCPSILWSHGHQPIIWHLKPLREAPGFASLPASSEKWTLESVGEENAKFFRNTVGAIEWKCKLLLKKLDEFRKRDREIEDAIVQSTGRSPDHHFVRTYDVPSPQPMVKAGRMPICRSCAEGKHPHRNGDCKVLFDWYTGTPEQRFEATKKYNTGGQCCCFWGDIEDILN